MDQERPQRDKWVWINEGTETNQEDRRRLMAEELVYTEEVGEIFVGEHLHLTTDVAR